MALDPRSCMYRCDQPERCGALVPPLKDRASSARHSTCSTVRPRDPMAEIRRRRAHPSFLRLLRLFNVDTGSAEIVHTYESDKTFAQSTVQTVTVRHAHPPPRDRTPRTAFTCPMPVHTQRVLNGWSGCGWVLGRYRRYLRPRPRHVQHASPMLPPNFPPRSFSFELGCTRSGRVGNSDHLLVSRRGQRLTHRRRLHTVAVGNEERSDSE